MLTTAIIFEGTFKETHKDARTVQNAKDLDLITNRYNKGGETLLTGYHV